MKQTIRTFLAIWLAAIFVFPPFIFPAAITSTGSGGDWNVGGSWTGGVIPDCASNDTVTIANGATIAIPAGISVCIGDSANPSTPAIQTAGTGGTGILTMGAGSSLEVRGNVKQGNAPWTASGGGHVIEFNNATALTWTVADSAPQTSSILTLTGLAGSRSIVRSNAGGANGRFIYPAQFNTGVIQADYVDFLRVGTSSLPLAQVQPGSGREAHFLHCTFTSSGAVTNPLNLPSGAILKINDNLFSSSAATDNVILALGSTYVAGTREMLRNDFDARVSISGGQNINFSYNTMQSTASVTELVTSGNASDQPGWTDNLIWRKRSGVTSWISGGVGTSTTPLYRHYLAFDFANTNPHGIQFPAGSNGVVEGWVFDGAGLTSAGELLGDMIINPVSPGSGTVVFSVKNNLLLESSTGKNIGKLTNTGNAPAGGVTIQQTVEHNTVMSAGLTETGVTNWGETYSGLAGTMLSFKSNLSVLASASASGALLTNRTNTGTVQDFVDPANATHNACYLCATGTDGYGYNATVTSPTATAYTTPPVAPLNADPNFVDRTRNIKTWSTFIGGAGTIASAFSEIRKRNDPTQSPNPLATPTQLIDYVRGGFAPRNTAYKNAGHDGVTIGAIEGVFGLANVIGAHIPGQNFVH